MSPHTPSAPQRHRESIFSLPQNLASPNFAKDMPAFGEQIWRLQQEGFRFLGERFEDNMKALRRLTACRTLPDVLAVQQKWFAQTAQAYGEEWSRCADLMTDAIKNGAADARENGSHLDH